MMSCYDIRAAARSAQKYTTDRTEFIQNSYPEEYWQMIENLASDFDDKVDLIIDEMKARAEDDN